MILTVHARLPNPFHPEAQLAQFFGIDDVSAVENEHWTFHDASYVVPIYWRFGCWSVVGVLGVVVGLFAGGNRRVVTGMTAHVRQGCSWSGACERLGGGGEAIGMVLRFTRGCSG